MIKRGQATIFIIFAIVIVVIIFALFIFVGPLSQVSAVNPTSFLRGCIEEDAMSALDIVSKQGGSLSPTHFLKYQDQKIQYLCFTSQFFEPCVIQQPLLKRHVEMEIEKFVEPMARECVKQLEDRYEEQGFNVQTQEGTVNVAFIPGSMNVEFLSPMTISRESSQTFTKFAIGIDSEMYDLLLTATSILSFESVLGDSETTTYLQYYPDLKVEKINRDEGDTIYRITDVISEEQFIFASRSLIWPVGYGVENQLQ